MDQEENRPFRNLGIRTCHVRALHPRLLGRLWPMLGTPPDTQMRFDGDVASFGPFPQQTLILMDTSEPPVGFITIWVDDIDAARRNLEARGMHVYDGAPSAGLVTPGFNLRLDGSDAAVSVRVDQWPKAFG